MAKPKPKLRRNYNLFVRVAKGETCGDLAKRYSVSRQRVHQLFEGTQSRIMEDVNTPEDEHKLGGMKAVIISSKQWIDAAKHSFNIQTGLQLENWRGRKNGKPVIEAQMNRYKMRSALNKEQVK